MSAELALREASPGWPLRRRQIARVMRQELARGLSLRHGLWLLFLAFAPACIVAAHALHARPHDLRNDWLVLPVIVQVFYVRFAVFFGCLGLALRLVRGELSQRTLHYPFLAPLRREALLVGRFLASAALATGVFGAGVLACSLLMFGHTASGRDFLAAGQGWSHVGAYLLATLLACIGYLAVSLSLTLLFKNPIVPAALIVFWEGVNGVLPVWLKHLSVTFYLKPTFPVELPVEGISGLFTIVAEPTPVWLAVVGLCSFAALALAFACWRLRRLELNYGAE